MIPMKQHRAHILGGLQPTGIHEKIADWIKNVLPTLHVHYEEINIFNPHHHRYIVNKIRNEKQTYIHLTNIFHYMPTAFYYSLKQRYALHNEILEAIKTKSLDNNVLLYSMCPAINQPLLNWVGNWKITSYNDLPDDNIGKFLKWNNTTTQQN